MKIYIVADTAAYEDIGIQLPAITPITASIPAIQVIEVRIPVIEIRDRHENRLITAIEILSPVNKRKPGIGPYLQKREKLHKAGVHLLEIDLLRRGKRIVQHPQLPNAHYLVALTRANRPSTDVWAFGIQNEMPVIPVPLSEMESDAVLDLGAAMKDIYQRGRYDLSIRYKETAPPPAFEESDIQWIQKVLQNR